MSTDMITVSWETKTTETHTISVYEKDVTPELWEALHSPYPITAVDADPDLYDEVYSGLLPDNEDTSVAQLNDLVRIFSAVII